MAKKASEAVETEVEETKTTKKTTAKKTTTKKTTKKAETVKVGKATVKSYDCIIKPILSEETMKNMETMNKITVQVNKNSNKVEIKNAFEAIFGVKVKQVLIKRLLLH